MLVGAFYFPTDYGIAIDELARALEARGFESLFVCEHTHIPMSRRTPFPGGGELCQLLCGGLLQLLDALRIGLQLPGEERQCLKDSEGRFVRFKCLDGLSAENPQRRCDDGHAETVRHDVRTRCKG